MRLGKARAGGGAGEFCAGWARAVVAECKRHGIEPPEPGIDASMLLAGIGTALPAAQLQPYWDEAGERCDMVEFISACHRRISVFDLGPFLGAMVAAPTIRQALQVMERYLVLVGDLFTVDTVADERVMLLRLRNSPQLSWQNQLLFLFVCVEVFGHLRRSPVRLHGVLLNHPDPGCGAALEERWRTPVLHNSGFTSLVMEPQDVDRLLPHRHDDVHAALVTLLERELQTRYSNLWLRVRDVVQGLLGEGELLSSDAVAERLHLSRRSLQRKLAEQGTSLSSICDEVRVQEATRLLVTTQRSIDWIAHHAGFQTQASFSKFFARRVGMSPRAYRRAQGA